MTEAMLLASVISVHGEFPHSFCMEDTRVLASAIFCDIRRMSALSSLCRSSSDNIWQCPSINASGVESSPEKPEMISGMYSSSLCEAAVSFLFFFPANAKKQKTVSMSRRDAVIMKLAEKMLMSIVQNEIMVASKLGTNLHCSTPGRDLYGFVQSFE